MENEPTKVTFEESQDRLKLTIPVRRNKLFLALYSLSLITWLVMLAIVIGYLLRGSSSGFVQVILLLIWIGFWLFLGRFLWKRWQFEVASREILFIEPTQLIIRRPVSILGLTTAYDLNHINPFYYSDKHNCLAFDYAYVHVYFGRSLTEDEGKRLIRELNGRLFPNHDPDN